MKRSVTPTRDKILSGVKSSKDSKASPPSNPATLRRPTSADATSSKLQGSKKKLESSPSSSSSVPNYLRPTVNSTSKARYESRETLSFLVAHNPSFSSNMCLPHETASKPPQKKKTTTTLFHRRSASESGVKNKTVTSKLPPKPASTQKSTTHISTKLSTKTPLAADKRLKTTPRTSPLYSAGSLKNSRIGKQTATSVAVQEPSPLRKEEEFTALRKQIELLQEQNQKLKTDLSQSESTIAQLQQHLKEKDEILSELNHNMSKLTSGLTKLKEENQKLQSAKYDKTMNDYKGHQNTLLSHQVELLKEKYTDTLQNISKKMAQFTESLMLAREESQKSAEREAKLKAALELLKAEYLVKCGGSVPPEPLTLIEGDPIVN